MQPNSVMDIRDCEVRSMEFHDNVIGHGLVRLMRRDENVATNEAAEPKEQRELATRTLSIIPHSSVCGSIRCMDVVFLMFQSIIQYERQFYTLAIF